MARANSSPSLTYAQLVIGTGCWAGVFIFGRLAVETTDPLYVAAARFLLAAVILVAIVIARGQLACVRRSDIPLILATGFTGIFLYNVFFFLGLRYSPVTHGAALIASSPVWTALIASFVLREELTVWKLAGIGATLAGVGVIIGRNVEIHTAQLFGGRVLLGDSLYLGAAIVWAVYSVLGKRVMDRFSPLIATTYAIIVGTTLLVPFAFLAEVSRELVLPDLRAVIAIVYMAVFGTVVAFFLWYKGIHQLGAARTSVFLNLVPVWVTILAAAFLQESITWQVLGAIALIVTGVCLVQSGAARIGDESAKEACASSSHPPGRGP